MRDFLRNSAGYMTALIVVLVGALAVALGNGFVYFFEEKEEHSQVVESEDDFAGILVPGQEGAVRENLQLDSLEFVTVTPVPTEAPTPTITPTNAPTPTIPASTIPPTQPPVVTFPPNNPAPQPPPATGTCAKPDQELSSPNQPCCNPTASRMYICTSLATCGSTSPHPIFGLGSNFCGFPSHSPPSNLGSCTLQCYAKPVIYLYPTIPTEVDVKLEIPGRVTISEPTYPPDTGWEDVLAFPDGTLWYKGEKYSDLFYETEVTVEVTPPNGIYIPMNLLEVRLREYITRLGLNEREAQNFLDYWVAEVEKLDTPFVLFSILTPEQKDRVDRVIITPQPDTEIMFLAYFKGIETVTPIEKLQLPVTPPARNGFTMVEWGGRIETDE